ncbi:MAG: branched-chain amino acid ABC transporter substrate-binding protein [Anaerosomatales bacterium]|nr:branched-chain amino acid ABC transporter substrate-binding protein [Anaerosomatales bacterium]
MWHERTRKLLAVGLALALAASMFGLVGCNGTEDGGEEDGGEAGATETIKIGVHTSLTGGLADYGFAAAEALKIAAEDFSGFEVDGTTYEIELVIKDDKGEPAEAPIVAQQLVDEGVIGVIGCLTSGNTNASLPIYQSAGIPVISGSATAPDLTEAGFENFFRTCLRDDLQGAAIGEWAVELGSKKAVVMDDRGDYAVALGNEVQAALEAAGVDVLRQEGQEGDVDFSAQVNNIKNFGPDAVIFTGYHREAGLLFKQLKEAGVDAQFMGGDGIKSDEIAAEAGGAENVEGALCTFGGFAQENMPGYAEFAAKFREATGKEAGPYSENNYDALGALVDAIKIAGGTDGAALIDALHEVEYDGVQGTLTFDDKGDVSVPGGGGTDLIPRFEFTEGTWQFIG